MFVILKSKHGLGDVRVQISEIAYYHVSGSNKGSALTFTGHEHQLHVEQLPEQIDNLIRDAWQAPINTPLL